MQHVICLDEYSVKDIANNVDFVSDVDGQDFITVLGTGG